MLEQLAVVAVTALAFGGTPDSAPAGTSRDGDLWVYLKAPLPSVSQSCSDVQPASPGQVRVPLFADRSSACPVATVDGTPITVRELAESLVGSHEARQEGLTAGKQDASVMVNRLIDVRLVALEAQAMGIDDLPEEKKAFAAVEERTAREMLKTQLLASARPPPAEVERLYRDAVREWKVRTVLFLRESDARAMAKQIKAGKGFDALAERAVADKKAKGNSPGEFLPANQLLNEIAVAIAKVPPGGATAPVKVPGGWAIVKVEEVRYPDDPKARAEATQRALVIEQKRLLVKKYDELVKRYAQVDRKLLKSIDFQAAKPGFDALRTDKRVLARIEGGKTITVGDLAKTLEAQLYHGVKVAAEKGKLNKQKYDAFDGLLAPEVVALEARRLGIYDSQEYRDRVAEESSALLFEAWVRTAVLPSVKVPEADVRKYYDQHKSDYKVPAFYKLETIGFATEKAAEAAVAKLRSGTDFKWLNANVDGKLAEGKDPGRPPAVVSATGATPAFAKALDGAKPGDHRVYAAAPGEFYAVHVLEIVPPSFQPFDQVKGAIEQKLFRESLQKAVQDWIARLRQAHSVQVYLIRIGS